MSSTESPAHFPVQSIESAPERSRDALARLKAAVGGVPNLAAVMASSPALIDSFVTLRTLFHAHSTFTKPERELIFLTNALENGCAYCSAIHTAFAHQEGLAAEAIQAVREKRLPADPRLAALVAFDRQLIRQRGRVSDAEVEAFLRAGFAPAQALELIAGAALSTLANFTGRLSQAPLDEFLVAHRLASSAEA